jgi:hypothetical protein
MSNQNRDPIVREQAMHKVMQLLRSTLCVFAFVGSTSAFAGQNVLYYQSQAGDFIGQGAEVTLTAADGTFTIFPSVQNGTRARFVAANLSLAWDLNVMAPIGTPLLLPGAYEDAQRWGFQAAGHPGLDFSGDGRGCNTLTGRFDVLELVRDASGAVIQLAINWEQHCEGMAPALFGQIRVNSDVPIIKKAKINLENPLNARGCVEASSLAGALVSMNANDAVDATGGTSLAFNWSSTTGAVGTAPAFSFNAPMTTDPANPVTVTLSITDLTNNIFRYTATRSVCVSDGTGPVIVINAPVPGQNVFGDSLILDVTIKDAIDKTITQHEVLVGQVYLSPLNPSTGHARQNVLAKPQANGSVALTITVRATDASGNTSQQSVTVTQFP